MVFRVSIVGTPKTQRPPSVEDSLLLRCLAMASECEVILTAPGAADLVLVYPYRFPLTSTLTGAMIESGSRVLARTPSAPWTPSLFRRLYGIPKGKRMLAVSHENLDRRPWQAFGNLILECGIPRLTFWPSEIDPDGCRFPYWWNYVDWPQVPRPGFGQRTRFGALYALEELCSPTRTAETLSRRPLKAAWITGHMEFPRDGVLRHLSQKMQVDVLHGVPSGRKLEALRSYAFCVTTENSTGYGYETEKVPEARVSGCLPIGYLPNPFSDFSSGAHFFELPDDLPESLPALLGTTPDLNQLMSYLASVIQA